MKEGLHPNYAMSTVICACGYTFQTRSTRPQIKVEICSNCHPFFTGKQKVMDTAGRMERFNKRYEKTSGKTIRTEAKTKAAVKITPARKVLTTGAKKAPVVPGKPEKDKKEAPKKK